MRNWDRRQLAMILAIAGILPSTRIVAQTAPRAPRRVGLMMAVSETDPEGQARLNAFRQGLQESGLDVGGQIVLDVVWYKGDYQLAETEAKALIDRKVEVLVINGTPGMDAVRAIGTSLPIVFVVVSNPVGVGYVPNLARPGGNITGFSTFEPEIAGKWLQILRQIAPGMKHVNVLIDAKFEAFNSLWQAVADVAPNHGIAAHAAHASSLAEIRTALETISGQDKPGLIVSPSPINTVHRQELIALANAARIPAIYPFRFYVRDGALVAYGFNAADQFRRAAGYVAHVLHGEKPGDLPVQPPRLFEFGVNLTTARQMGLSVPEDLLLSADEIIQ